MNPFIIAAKHYLPTIVNITIKQGFYILFSCGVLLSACSQPIVTTIKVNNDSIFIGGDINRTRFFHYCVEDIYMDSIPVFADTILLVQSFLRPEMELAYNMAVKNGCIQIHFSVDQNDTTILYHCKCNKRHSFNTEIIGCDYSKIEPSFKKNAQDVRKWLYHNGIGTNPDDTLVSKIIQYHYFLEYINDIVKQTDEAYFDKFIIEKEIPIISTKDNKMPILSVTSDMIANCYYVFVASTSSELNTLIEWQCANNFEQRISKLPHKIQPYRSKQEDGVYCIFLVGINNDWTTQIDPIGLICIDNNAPYLSSNSIDVFLSNRQFSDDYSSIEHHYVLTFTKPQILISYNSQQLPLYKGTVAIQWGNFEGRGNVMRIPYTFSWSGDVRYIRIINEKKCDEFSYLAAQKIIQIDTHQHSSPYQTIFNTYLPNTGDNFLQVELEDNQGNISRHTINITTHRIDEGSNISINNNIYNNIY